MVRTKVDDPVLCISEAFARSDDPRPKAGHLEKVEEIGGTRAWNRIAAHVNFNRAAIVQVKQAAASPMALKKQSIVVNITKKVKS
jgi:hypothetical protein